MKIEEFRAKKTYLWGTGTEGQAILSWWSKNFPNQTLGIIENNEIPEDAEVIIKSPGVSSYLPQIVEAKKKRIQFTSMMNIFLANLKTENRPKIIAITGTKGKSTSASMMAMMLEKMGFRVGLGGNIGIIPLDFLEQELDYIVLELSSFQIYDITYPLLDYVTITNISQAHTDWHLTYENYKKDKLDIIKLAKHKVLNYHDDYLRQAKTEDITYYNVENGFWAKDGKIFEGKEEIVLPKLNVFGDHNLSNICGLLAILKMLDIDYKKAVMFLADYHPLDHRLQKVHEKNGLTFINDSIATVADSVIAGVNAFKEDIALIVGGYDNGPDYSELNKFIANEKRIRIAICLPDTGRMLTAEKCVQVNTMREAVECAVKNLDKGIVLLSPAAPSFNMYKNYKERGEDFAKLAKEIDA